MLVCISASNLFAKYDIKFDWIDEANSWSELNSNVGTKEPHACNPKTTSASNFISVHSNADFKPYTSISISHMDSQAKLTFI